MYQGSIPVAQVRFDGILLFEQWQGAKCPKTSVDLFRDKAYSGSVKYGAAKRMRSAVDVMVQCSRVSMIHRPGKKLFPFRLAFQTLTIPGRLRTAKEVKPVFQRYLAWLRRQNAAYVWKAEYQKRGQIHYHLIVDRYVHWKDIQFQWNRLCHKARFLDEYAKAYGHFHPNSTDVRAVKSNKALTQYLMKYLAKPDTVKVPKNRMITKWWGASSHLLGGRFVFNPSSAEWDRLKQAKEIITDENEHWAIYKGEPGGFMDKATRGGYTQWKRNLNASWKPSYSVSGV